MGMIDFIEILAEKKKRPEKGKRTNFFLQMTKSMCALSWWSGCWTQLLQGNGRPAPSKSALFVFHYFSSTEGIFFQVEAMAP